LLICAVLIHTERAQRIARINRGFARPLRIAEKSSEVEGEAAVGAAGVVAGAVTYGACGVVSGRW
jgi:hypothetical protein